MRIHPFPCKLFPMATRDYFKGKRIAVIGLGAQGEMVEDVKYLIKAGAWVSIYDLKSEARLKTHLIFLRSVGLANYVCGSIPADDLLDMDLIILSHEYPRDSSFLKEVNAQNNKIVADEGQALLRSSQAESSPLHQGFEGQVEGQGKVGKEGETITDAERKIVKKIPIEYPETLFFKIAPPVTLVGVMGACGKSTVISILAPLLREVCAKYESQKLYVIDPESEDGILAHVKRIKSGDIVIIRVVDSILSELANMRISPHVAVFTTIPPKNSYADSPFEILAFQTYNNFIVASDEVIDATKQSKIPPRAKMLRTKSTLVPTDWGFEGLGQHNKHNAALALEAARLFKVDDDMARHVIGDWKGLKGRLELVKKVKNVEFYNDTMSATPEATLAGVAALSQGRNVILIFGGAEVGHEYKILYAELPRYVHTVVNIPGSGTIRQRASLEEIQGLKIYSTPTIEEAVLTAFEQAQKGDRILFSPGFAAGGVDGSKVERGERFVRAVRGL